jgi:hypothetical protein
MLTPKILRQKQSILNEHAWPVDTKDSLHTLTTGSSPFVKTTYFKICVLEDAGGKKRYTQERCLP